MKNGKSPLVLGVGGLLEQEESGRIQEMLARLQERGCIIYSVRFNTICRDGNTILCPMSNQWVGNFTATAEAAIQDSRVDITRIGIIASSIGATIADYAIATTHLLSEGLGPYASISPLARPHPDTISGIKYLMKHNLDLEVSFPHDKEKGIRRVIPHANLGNILQINTPPELEKRSRAYNIKPLTIVGIRDDRCDTEASRERHRVLGGSNESLLEYEEGHGVPAELTEKPILEFMTRELRLVN